MLLPIQEASLKLREVTGKQSPLSRKSRAILLKLPRILHFQPWQPYGSQGEISLQSMPGKFSGLHLLCYEYVAFQQIAPGKDIGFDLSAEYGTARALFEKKS